MALLVLCLLSLPLLVRADNLCLQCGSEVLRDNWEVTSFPTRPADFQFTSKCDNPPVKTDTTLEQQKLVKSCSESCFTMIVPVGNTPAFLRGCYSSDFGVSGFPKNSNNMTCNYGPVKDKTYSLVDTTGVVTGPAYSMFAAHTFLSSNTDLANAYYDSVAALVSNPTNYFGTCTPSQAMTKKCVSCSKLGGEGTCDAGVKDTCDGAYCVKFVGYLGNDWFEMRGCSPMSPFDKDLCTTVNTTSSVNLGINQLTRQYQGTHCYCSGEMCNPAAAPSSLLGAAAVLLVAQLLPLGWSSSSP